MTIHIMPDDSQYHTVEIFESLRGEDWNTGTPAVFIRLGKCNLACSWCDTDYLKFDMMSLSDILGRLKAYMACNIIITGGEPIIQPHLDTLLNTLKVEGYFLCIKTNGLNPALPQIDYIAINPKACYAAKYEKSCTKKADEIRTVAGGEVITFCQEMKRKVRARRYYLSPCEQDGAVNIYDTIRQIGMLNSRVDALAHWRPGV